MCDLAAIKWQINLTPPLIRKNKSAYNGGEKDSTRSKTIRLATEEARLLLQRS